MNNRLRDYICNRNMDKIRNTFKKYFSASGLELPDDISPYGELSSKDGWHLIYSLAEDCDMNPLLKFEASHRMTNTRYISIDSSGELDGLDIDETDSSAIRLSGLGDNADYLQCRLFLQKSSGTRQGLHIFLGKFLPVLPMAQKRFQGIGHRIQFSRTIHDVSESNFFQ